MMNLKFDTWISLVYLRADLSLREGKSLHQRQIIKIFDAIQYAAKTHDVSTLLQITPVPCNIDTDLVAYCRYLQHCVGILKNEGTME